MRECGLTKSGGVAYPKKRRVSHESQLSIRSKRIDVHVNSHVSTTASSRIPRLSVRIQGIVNPTMLEITICLQAYTGTILSYRREQPNVTGSRDRTRLGHSLFLR